MYYVTQATTIRQQVAFIPAVARTALGLPAFGETTPEQIFYGDHFHMRFFFDDFFCLVSFLSRTIKNSITSCHLFLYGPMLIIKKRRIFLTDFFFGPMLIIKKIFFLLIIKKSLRILSHSISFGL